MALIPLALTTLLLGASAPALLTLFVILYGAGLGLTTIMRATTPAELFGRKRYASVSGALSGPAIMARALGPLLATAVLSAFGDYSIVLVFLLGIALAGAVAYWIAMRMHRRR